MKQVPWWLLRVSRILIPGSTRGPSLCSMRHFLVTPMDTLAYMRAIQQYFQISFYVPGGVLPDMSVYHKHAVPSEDRREHSLPWN